MDWQNDSPLDRQVVNQMDIWMKEFIGLWIDK